MTRTGARSSEAPAADVDAVDLDGDSLSSEDPSSDDSEGDDSDHDPRGGGGPGGGGGAPSDPGSSSDGSQLAPEGPADMTWAVDESDVYKDKDLHSVTCPTIPSDAAGWRGFWNDIKVNMSSIDRSAEDHLTVWIDLCRSVLGGLKDVMRAFDDNSQGLVRLDRFLGKAVADKGK